MDSINIQRGRDHGVNSFTAVRKACMQQGRFRSLYKGAKMKKGWSNIVKLYGSVAEVDLYVGMLMEEPVPGSKVSFSINLFSLSKLHLSLDQLLFALLLINSLL